MARPKKNNASYFSHDADMRNDLKIKAIRNKFGITGYAVWCMMLEVLTDSENFECSFDDLNKELLSADFGIESDLLAEIIYYCVILRLLVIENSVVYSNEHRKRFKPLIEKRNRDRIRIHKFADEKVEVKIEVENDAVKLPKFIPVDNICEYLLDESNVLWQESFCMNNSISKEQLSGSITEFCSWLADGGATDKNEKDIKTHFRNWYKIAKNGRKINQRGTKTINPATAFSGLASERKVKSAI